ncbi:MAG: histidinol phosphatase, partial [Mesotoga sp.]|nr:histidinol phosphatase [Mesotoga sp.]
LEEMGNRVSTADRIFKVGELDTIDVLLLPLPGAGGSFDRLKILMPQQSNIIKEFVMNGGRLIITGTGDEISNEIISSYNRLLEEMGIYATYEKAITSDAVELDGIVFDGLSVLRGESGRHVYGKGEILLFPGDPFTDDVIENNKELLDQSFR